MIERATYSAYATSHFTVTDDSDGDGGEVSDVVNHESCAINHASSPVRVSHLWSVSAWRRRSNRHIMRQILALGVVDKMSSVVRCSSTRITVVLSTAQPIVFVIQSTCCCWPDSRDVCNI